MFRPAGTIAIYTLKEALMNRMFRLVLLSAAAAFAFSLFLGLISVTESLQVRNAFLAAAFRLNAVFVLSAFIIVSASREESDKTTEFLMSFPMPRASFFLGKLGGFILCASLFALFSSLPLLWQNAWQAVFMWGTSLFLELALMAAVSLFFAIMLRNALSALFMALGFYFLARTTGVLLLLASGPLADHGAAGIVIEHTIGMIAFLLPRFDLYTQTSWLVYSPPLWHEWLGILWQSAIYLLLICAAALFDLYRKNL